MQESDTEVVWTRDDDRECIGRKALEIAPPGGEQEAEDGSRDGRAVDRDMIAIWTTKCEPAGGEVCLRPHN